jgi:hypothetical protein
MPDLIAQSQCRHNDCTESTERGYVLCPTHETDWHADKAAHEPESDSRQFVRYAYAEDCQLPYRPASLEPKTPPDRAYRQPPIDRVLAALNAAGCLYRPSATDVDSWQAECPTHEDSRPSLHVRRNHDGTIWIKCWAGCPKEGILAALGLEWRDLWEASEHDSGRAKPFVRPLLPPHLRRAMEEAIRLDDLTRRRAAA